jgi:hypothetical protein
VTPENHAIAEILCGHMRKMARIAGQIPADKFDWTYAPPAPTPRTLVTHAWQWLICDRYHIEQPDASMHPRVPDPPADQQALCAALASEADTWEKMLLAMSFETMAEKRHQFNDTNWDWSVRGSVYHMIQNAIYKHGQLSTIYFALGLDGTEPYEAPFPNPIYAEVFGPDWPAKKA